MSIAVAEVLPAQRGSGIARCSLMRLRSRPELAPARRFGRDKTQAWPIKIRMTVLDTNVISEAMKPSAEPAVSAADRSIC